MKQGSKGQRIRQQARRVGLWGLLGSVWLGCGVDKPEAKPIEAFGSPGEKAFHMAAQAYHVPQRLLMAIAYLESQLAPQVASARYGELTLGPALGETAFGISRAKLGLGTAPEHDDLSVQIDAYAKWLNTQVPPGLPQQPKSDSEKFLWISELAELHRSKTNTRSLFMRELIAILNKGFSWVDPRTGSVVAFEPENPAIDPDKLQKVAKNRLALDLRRAEINTARMMMLRGAQIERPTQKAQGVEVIHCPFALSACLELQARDRSEGAFALGAHYVIPHDDSLRDIDMPLQVALHDDTVDRLSPEGQPQPAASRIVVMLVGNSGRLIAGQRQAVNPAWLSKWQLKRMGELVYDICTSLAYAAELRGEEFAFDSCRKVDEGTLFRTNSSGTGFQWGDLVDYDPLLFRSYAERPDGLEGQTVFEFPDDKFNFGAGSEVKFDLSFDARVQHIELERLVRCPEGGVVWTPVAYGDVRSAVTYPFKIQLWDAGPNGNGSQFLRAKVYGAEGEMRGWDLASIFLSNYEATPAHAPHTCRTNQGQVK